jgi:hypothetical protein
MSDLFKTIDSELSKNVFLNFKKIKTANKNLVKDCKDELDKINKYKYDLNKYRSYIVHFLNLAGEKTTINKKKEIIINILNNAKHELHAKDIFQKLKELGCKNFYIDHNKLGSYLNMLKKEGIICNGSKKGYWKAKEG